ncbi:MAG TPA: hypothetical protein VFM63_13505, partial [Pyrinomonadaceae bacterium]|nr:hypothetical protein [Pyrinomonadaceae bacterium]
MPSKKNPSKTATKTASSKKASKKPSNAKKNGKNGHSGEEIKGADIRHTYISGETFGLKKVVYGVVDGEAM